MQQNGPEETKEERKDEWRADSFDLDSGGVSSIMPPENSVESLMPGNERRKPQQLPAKMGDSGDMGENKDSDPELAASMSLIQELNEIQLSQIDF